MSPSEIPSLFAELPDAFASRFNPAAPWELLGEPLDEILAACRRARSTASSRRTSTSLGDRIVICPGARIHPTAVIEGPVYIGRDVEIRPGAYLRGGVWIGDRCIVGANTEIKRAILLPHAKAPHLNYVGDSILGADVNLGAGTILSNFRHDGGQIRIPRERRPARHRPPQARRDPGRRRADRLQLRPPPRRRGGPRDADLPGRAAPLGDLPASGASSS